MVGAADGVVAGEAVIKVDFFDADAHPKGEARDARAVDGAQFLATHVVVAKTEVESAGDDKFAAKNQVTEDVVDGGAFGLDEFAAEVVLRLWIGIDVDEFGPLQLDAGHGKAQGHVLELVRYAGLHLKWNGFVRPTLDVRSQLDTHIFEYQGRGEKLIVGQVSAAQIEGQRGPAVVAGNGGIDEFEVGADAVITHLAGAAHHKGQITCFESAGLVAVHIGRGLFAVIDKLKSGVEIADSLEGAGIAGVTIGDAGEVIDEGKGGPVVHGIVEDGRVLEGEVVVVVDGGDIHPTQTRHPRLGREIQEVVHISSPDLGEGKSRQQGQ